MYSQKINEYIRSSLTGHEGISKEEYDRVAFELREAIHSSIITEVFRKLTPAERFTFNSILGRGDNLEQEQFINSHIDNSLERIIEQSSDSVISDFNNLKKIQQ